jgi:signal transduction histidine kinase
MINHASLNRRWANRSLTGKLTTILILVAATVIPAIFFTIWLSAKSVFLDIETKSVNAQVARATNSVRLFEVGLSKSLGDYADWDDSYNYLENPSRAFEDSTLNPHTFSNMGVDLITYVRFDGTVVFARAVDTTNQTILPAESAAFAGLTSKGSFFESAKAKKNHLAYIRTQRGLYVLYSQWLSDSEGKASSQGFIVMGNLLGAKMLSDALQSDVKLNLSTAPAVASVMNAKSRRAIFTRKSTAVESKIGVFGQDQRLLATISFETPRNLIIAGRQALLTLVLAILGGIALMLLILSRAVRLIVVKRLSDLESLMRDYRSNPEMPAGLTASGDEIGSLAKSFGQMSDELHAAEQELSQKSYLQGKADSAAGMLHNVRNALAPVRVMQEKWLREETLPFRQNMGRAAAELARDDLDAARRASLEAFMISAARQIALANPGRLAEMEETKGSVDQIAAILGGYNFNMSGTSAGDEIDFLKLLAHEVKAIDGRDGANVTFDLPDAMPHLLGNPLHLSQVLGNILVNADEAMIAAGVPDKRMTVRFAVLEGDIIEIRLTDNGDGIAPENLSNTFNREYSTRTHKAGGIGLHWSANAMRAMGGSIALESEGAGQGATAVITLRAAARVELSAAA